MYRRSKVLWNVALMASYAMSASCIPEQATHLSHTDSIRSSAQSKRFIYPPYEPQSFLFPGSFYPLHSGHVGTGWKAATQSQWAKKRGEPLPVYLMATETRNRGNSNQIQGKLREKMLRSFVESEDNVDGVFDLVPVFGGRTSQHGDPLIDSFVSIRSDEGYRKIREKWVKDIQSLEWDYSDEFTMDLISFARMTHSGIVLGIDKLQSGNIARATAKIVEYGVPIYLVGRNENFSESSLSQLATKLEHDRTEWYRETPAQRATKPGSETVASALRSFASDTNLDPKAQSGIEDIIEFATRAASGNYEVKTKISPFRTGIEEAGIRFIDREILEPGTPLEIVDFGGVSLPVSGTDVRRLWMEEETARSSKPEFINRFNQLVEEGLVPGSILRDLGTLELGRVRNVFRRMVESRSS